MLGETLSHKALSHSINARHLLNSLVASLLVKLLPKPLRCSLAPSTDLVRLSEHLVALRTTKTPPVKYENQGLFMHRDVQLPLLAAVVHVAGMVAAVGADSK